MDSDLFNLKIKELEAAYKCADRALIKIREAKDEMTLLSIIAEQLVLLNNKVELIRIKL